MPILIFWPIALLLALFSFSPGVLAKLFSGGYERVTIGSFVFFAGLYGLLVLPISILAPVSFVRERRWLRIALSALLAGGCFTALSLASEITVEDFEDPKRLLLLLWFIGGPVVVAVWNTARFCGWRYKPRAPIDSRVIRDNPPDL